MIAQGDLAEALRVAQAAWSGCNWKTEFGVARINLCGLRSQQVRLAAQATRGAEATCWQAACHYLETVERDARQAAELARRSIDKWHLGDIESARQLLDDAIALEAQYRPPIAYASLRELISRANPPLGTA